MSSEASNRGGSFQHFPRPFKPGIPLPPPEMNFFAPFQSSHPNPKHGFAAVPLRSIAPTNDTNPTKTKKNNPSSKKPNLAPKKPKKNSSNTKTPKPKNVERKNPNTGFDKVTVDISKVPPPFCSCTGSARPCYKCGVSGWQSSCCTSSVSDYPLPMRPSRPGTRLSGRKMSNGAYQKLLYKLVAKGHDASQAVDLKDHWAKHGTNKFVTIK